MSEGMKVCATVQASQSPAPAFSFGDWNTMRENPEILRTGRLLDEGFSLERAWFEINAAPARAAASTIEALIFSLRAGGAALVCPHARRRLSELSEAQLHEVSARLQKLHPNIARAWTPVEVELLVAIWIDLHG
jgi:hypothetical protein